MDLEIKEFVLQTIIHVKIPVGQNNFGNKIPVIKTNLKIIIFSKKFFFFSRGFLNQVVGDVVQDGVVGDDPHVHGGLGVVDVPVFLGLLPQVPLLIQIGNDFG